jgi:aspartate kinase
MTVGSGQVVVVKLGGSVLADDNSYRGAAASLARRLESYAERQIVVVVSARKGVTDALERQARDTTAFPDPRTMDLLWSTGEMYSVALLTLHLEELGVKVAGLNIHETGFRCEPKGRVKIVRKGIDEALKRHSVVVVPGFFATTAKREICSLGRGGSDLTAVLLAEEFAADCELIKDVSGYFTTDPALHCGAEFIPRLSYEQALGMAGAGCELVQPRAIEAARRARVRLIVRGLDESAPRSIVSEEEAEFPQLAATSRRDR